MGRGARIFTTAGVAIILVSSGLRTSAHGGIDSGTVAATVAVTFDHLLIRVYDNSGGLTAGERSDAISRAGAILNRADVAVEWIDCPASRLGRPSPACANPPAQRDLVVRLVNAPADDLQDTTARALGYSLIDAATGTGTLATVFVDRVIGVAAGARVARSTILGRALAHEIGHLMLGTNEHSADGIMRERWTSAQLVNGEPQDWLFLSVQRDEMRRTRLLGASRGPTIASRRRLPDRGW